MEEKKQKRRYGPSTVATLRVARLGEMGAFLDAGTGNTSDDILLHKLQQTAPVKVGDEVTVFLYRDPKRRLTASMRVPIKMASCEVAASAYSGSGMCMNASAGNGTPPLLRVKDALWLEYHCTCSPVSQA